jgi:hypothetical protein
VTVSLLVLLCSNVYLSEVAKSINTSARKIEIADIIALVIILGLCIGFGCYFLFRPTENAFNINPHSSASADTKAGKNFEVVPRSIISQNSDAAKALYSYTNTTGPQVASPLSTGKIARAVVLAVNGKLEAS